MLDPHAIRHDYDTYIRQAIPLYKLPRMMEAMALLRRNPGLAPAVEAFILAHEGAVGLDVALDWNPAA